MAIATQEKVEYGAAPKTLQSYLVGFTASLILSLLAFALVQWKLFAPAYLYFTLGVLALVQLLVQARCFLRLNASKEGQWDLLPFLFTLFIIVILAGGSLWIMYNLNANMH